MKKVLLIIALLSFGFIANAQKDIQYGVKVIGKQKPGFYKTYDDLLNDKIEYLGDQAKGWDIETAGGVKLDKTTYHFSKVDYYGFKDDDGNRYRIADGRVRNMFCAGKICIYIKGYNMGSFNNKTKQISRTISSDANSIYLDFSNGLTAPIQEIKKFSKREQVADLIFKDDEAIKNEFLNDSNDDLDPDCKKCVSDDLERIIFYVNKYNAAHK